MELTIPDLSPSAQAFLDRILPRIREGLNEVNQIPVALLLWGPGVGSSHPLASVRVQLRSRLRQLGHLAMFSEELCDAASEHSMRLQELVQARTFDLVVAIPATPGSIAEVHEFASHPSVRSKMLIFVNNRHIGGYSEQSIRALSTVLTAQVEYYPDEEHTEEIERITIEQAQRVRELKYIYGWKENS